LFGRSGIEILRGILSGRSVEEVIGGTDNRWIKKHAEEIKQAVRGSLGLSQVFVIKECLDVIKSIDDKIREIDAEIRNRIRAREEDLKIAMSVPGIGFISASTILAEIGNIRDFITSEKLASWAGMVPSVYQSADKLNFGRITKRGSKHLRRILAEVANAAIKVKSKTSLKIFFQRVKARQGFSKAIVALGRKILCILHHLLTNREPYSEEGKTIKKGRLPKGSGPAPMTADEMIKTLSEAGYVIYKPIMG